MITKPMLAGTIEDVKALRFPVIASPKLDGIRFVKLGGKGLARSLKPIKNNHVRATLEGLCPDGIDGELMAGDTFQACTSAVMSASGEPAFTLWAFDIVTESLAKPYVERLKDLSAAVRAIGDTRVKVVPVKIIEAVEGLLAFEEECLAKGFEGVMVRSPEGPYKCGRSTEREGWLLKLKRFVDAEAEVIGVEEMMHNDNVAKTNELGHTQRSSAKAGLRPAGTLGNFLVRDAKGVEFSIGTGEGLTAKLRKELWEKRDALVGKIVKFKYQAVGVKDAPRIPIWLGFRDEADM